MTGHYRPSGPLRWILEKLPNQSQWDLLGSVAAEPRAVEVAKELVSLGKLRSSQFLCIEDEPSEFQDNVRAACSQHQNELADILGRDLAIQNMALFSEVDELGGMYEEAETRISENVILDISALPKRFFFYLIRRLRDSAKVQNLLVAYTLPDKYGKTLYKNPGGWMPLPSFGIESSTTTAPMLVVAVGYHHLKLLDLIEERTPNPVRLLMPFPSIPPGFAQNWEFVRYVQEQVDFIARDIRRVDPFSVSLAFEHLHAQCLDHEDELLLAPFGPKPISLAMALYALWREDKGLPVAVGYTQPTAYSDTYSSGVRRARNGNAVIHTYCIKQNGLCLYHHDGGN
jgi:hypothetical protein